MRLYRITCLAGLSLLAARAAAAEPVVLPGDRGRPPEGFAPLRAPGGVPAAPAPAGAARVPGPPLSLALQAARAVAESCRQFPLGVAVVDSVGTPKLVYVPDGSQGWHGYSAIRKAWTALVFKVPTRELADRIRTNTALQARVRADPNLMAFNGGRPWLMGGEIVGAIAVSGAEPGGHDDDCLLQGIAKVSASLGAAGSQIP